MFELATVGAKNGILTSTECHRARPPKSSAGETCNRALAQWGLLVGVEGVDDQAHQLLDIRIERERLGRHGNKRCPTRTIERESCFEPETEVKSVNGSRTKIAEY